MLRELEFRRMERHGWRDGCVQFGLRGGLRDGDLCNRRAGNYWWNTVSHG